LGELGIDGVRKLSDLSVNSVETRAVAGEEGPTDYQLNMRCTHVYSK